MSAQPSQDTDLVRLLSIFHYVVAALTALFSMFPFIHMAIGIAIITGAFDDSGNGNAPPAFIGWIFVVVASVAILCGMTLAVCMAIAGKRLKQCRNYTYCLVVSCVECIFMPFGSVLGIFTIIVLMRPTVKELFESSHAR